MSVRQSVIDVLVDARATGLDSFAATGAAALGMADDFQSAASQADTAASKMDGLSESADNLDDKAGRATGAMGALSSGFALIGADQAAAALESAAMATDFLSGAGQALNLVMDLEIAKRAAATATTIGQTVATTAQTAASKAAAAGQWALNAALSANPLGVVIALLVATAAAVVIAYKRSEDFREKVDAAMGVARAAFNGVSDAVSAVVGWLRDKVPPAFSWLQDKASGVIEAAFAPFETAGNVIEGVRDFIRDKVAPAVTTMKEAVVPVAEAVVAPFVAIKNAVEDVVAWIAKIDFPDMPGWVSKIPGVSGRYNLQAATAPVVVPTSSMSDPAAIALLTAIRDLLAAAVGGTPSSSPAIDSSTLARLLGELLRREGILKGGAV